MSTTTTTTAAETRQQRRTPVAAAPFVPGTHRGWSLPATAALVVGCGVLGVAAGYAPVLLLAAVAAVALVLLILTDIATGLAVFTVLQFFAMVPFIGGQQVTAVKATGALLAVSWVLVTIRARTRPDRRPVADGGLARFPAVVVMLLLFLVWGGLSYLWAIDSDHVLVDWPRYALNFMLFAIVATAVHTPRHVTRIAAAVVIGTTVAACSDRLFVPENDPDRLAGALGDPNDLAAALVPGVILAFALFGIGIRWWRWLYLAAALIGLLSMFLTASRGGLIGFAAALVVWLVVGGRWRRRIAVATGSVLGGGVLYYLLAAPAGLAERISDPGDGSGRLDIWWLGWRVFEDRPVLGAGMGNFSTATPQYLVEPGLVARADRILVMPKVAHNMYLSMLSELGLPGFVLFTGITLSSLLLMAMAARIFARLAIPGLDVLSAAFVAGLTGLLVADFFLTGQHEKHLWLLLGMGPALLLMARREAAARISPVVPPARARVPAPEPARSSRP